MKRSIQLLVLLCVIVVGIMLVNKVKDNNAPTETVIIPEIQQGTITIVNMDENTMLPIRDTTYTITYEATDVVLDTLKTDETGKGTSSLLDYGTKYTIRQTEVMLPYKLSETEFHIEVSEPSMEVEDSNQMYEHVKAIERALDGQIEISSVYIEVDTLMQKPELPNGCEIVSLTAVLNYYGYEVSKTEMADVYLPKEPFFREDNKLFGPDPYKAYSGNPRDLKGGFFSYSPPIVEAAKSYLDAVGGSNSVADISGSTREQIIEYLNKGIPVVIWTTLDMSKPKITYGWHLNDTGEYFPAPVNLHVVVLNGYEDNLVHVMNPLKGQVTYDADVFFNSYDEMGSHALIVGN